MAQPAPLDTLPAFIRQLMGLVKYAVAHKESEMILEEAAAALGHRATTIRLGLDWLAAQGKLNITVDEPDVLVVQPVAHLPHHVDADAFRAVLETNLSETAAFRSFFRRAGLSAIEKMEG